MQYAIVQFDVPSTHHFLALMVCGISLNHTNTSHLNQIQALLIISSNKTTERKSRLAKAPCPWFDIYRHDMLPLCADKMFFDPAVVFHCNCIGDAPFKSGFSWHHFPHTLFIGVNLNDFLEAV
jgi:hypothetical protein